MTNFLTDKQKYLLEQRAKGYGSYKGFIQIYSYCLGKIELLPENKTKSIQDECLDFTKTMLALKLARMLIQKDFDLKSDSYDDLMNYLVLAQELCNNFKIIIKDFKRSKAYIFWMCKSAKKELFND